MNKLFLMLVGLALLTSCSRNQLPSECRDLRGFLDMQSRELVEMQAAFATPSETNYSETRKLARSLFLKQDRILKACQAEIVARGMDCRQAEQALLVSDARMKMSMLSAISDREYKVLGQRYIKAILANAIQDASAEVSGELCD